MVISFSKNNICPWQAMVLMYYLLFENVNVHAERKYGIVENLTATIRKRETSKAEREKRCGNKRYTSVGAGEVKDERGRIHNQLFTILCSPNNVHNTVNNAPVRTGFQPTAV